MAIAYGSSYTTASGNSSFRVCCNYTITTNSTTGDKTVEYYYYVEVTKGSFSSANIYSTWRSSTFVITGVGTYGKSDVYTLSIPANSSAKSIPAASASTYANMSNASTVNAISIPASSISSFTNIISHWLFPFIHGEGNNSAKDSFQLANSTSFTQTYNTEFTLDVNKCIQIPYGCYWAGIDSGITGTWTRYEINSKFVQQGKSMSFQYTYSPRTYTITYDLDGGINNSNNPSSYNVLYGVSLYEASKIGYEFSGWKDHNGNIITGINEGKDAIFASVDDLYSQLKSRRIGNILLTAQWIPNEYMIVFNSNGGTNVVDSLSVSYQTSKNNNISQYIPKRNGYRFLGFYTTEGIQVYDEDGMYVNNDIYWSEGLWVLLNDCELYAKWELLNVSKMKLNGKWLLGYTYTKHENTWIAQIMKTETDGDWIYQIKLIDESGNYLTDENGDYLYKL